MLRHTAVVWALEAGVKLQVVSHALGHASIQTTYDIYGGLMDLHDPEMARALAQMTDL
jgi:integrase